jgi:ribosome biogenesis GTPase
MAHLRRYDSFQTNRSKAKKERAKIKSGYYGGEEYNSDFVVSEDSVHNAIVVETTRYNVSALYKNNIVSVELSQAINGIPNRLLYPGDKIFLKSEGGKLVVANLIKRTTCLSRIRKDSTRRNDEGNLQIIAANIDIAAIVVSAKKPPLHPKFIDRYLMIIQKNEIEPVIVLNKSDLKEEENERVLKVYRDLGIRVVETSATSGAGILKLKEVLMSKQAIFVGNSGVGKSSLTNAIMDYDEIRVGYVNDKSGKGRHTTTSSKYYIWEKDSSIIDTPGIRSLDVSSFESIEVQDYFPEIHKYSLNCKYSDCLHYKDSIETCGVKQAVQSGLIDEGRYKSYIRIISDLLGDRFEKYDMRLVL